MSYKMYKYHIYESIAILFKNICYSITEFNSLGTYDKEQSDMVSLRNQRLNNVNKVLMGPATHRRHRI